MAASVGLDPETSFTSPYYGIEARFLDEGFGALTYHKVPMTPMMQEMFGTPPEDSPDEVPDKSKMN